MTTQDLRTTTYFNRIIKNYLKMERIVKDEVVKEGVEMPVVKKALKFSI